MYIYLKVLEMYERKKKEKCDKFLRCISPLVHAIQQKITDLFSPLEPAFWCCFNHTQANTTSHSGAWEGSNSGVAQRETTRPAAHLPFYVLQKGPIDNEKLKIHTVSLYQFSCKVFWKTKVNPPEKLRREKKSINRTCFSHFLFFFLFVATKYFAASGFKKLTEITEKMPLQAMKPSTTASPIIPLEKIQPALPPPNDDGAAPQNLPSNEGTHSCCRFACHYGIVKMKRKGKKDRVKKKHNLGIVTWIVLYSNDLLLFLLLFLWSEFLLSSGYLGIVSWARILNLDCESLVFQFQFCG